MLNLKRGQQSIICKFLDKYGRNVTLFIFPFLKSRKRILEINKLHPSFFCGIMSNKSRCIKEGKSTNHQKVDKYLKQNGHQCDSVCH